MSSMKPNLAAGASILFTSTTDMQIKLTLIFMAFDECVRLGIQELLA